MDTHSIKRHQHPIGFDALFVAPFSTLGIRTDGQSVTDIEYLPRSVPGSEPNNELARETIRQIEAYLSDPGFQFDLPLRVEGSDFRKRVWKVMCAIPVGETLTYGDVARRLESAPRAVGGACGDNRLPLIIPCHRIVGSNGIGGFMHATGNRETGIKRWLLNHERAAITLPA